MSDESPNRDRAQDRIGERKSDRAATTESILDDVERDFGELAYPITSEELATEYATEAIDMPNETESLGSVFDRLAGEQFDSPEDVREAVYGEITGTAGGRNEANAQRNLRGLEEETGDSLGESGSDQY